MSRASPSRKDRLSERVFNLLHRVANLSDPAGFEVFACLDNARFALLMAIGLIDGSKDKTGAAGAAPVF